MGASAKAIRGLRIITGTTILVGAFGVVAGVVVPQTLYCFGASIPAWAPGALVTMFGLTRWLRIDRLERQPMLGRNS